MKNHPASVLYIDDLGDFIFQFIYRLYRAINATHVSISMWPSGHFKMFVLVHYPELIFEFTNVTDN